MKYLFVLFAFLLSCSDSVSPDAIDAGFTSNSVPGKWRAESIFAVELEGKYVYSSRETFWDIQQRTGRIEVTGKNIYVEVNNALGTNEVLFFEGVIDNQIVGKYWMSYDKTRRNLIFRRIK